MPRIQKRVKQITLMVSAFAALAIVAFAYLAFRGTPSFDDLAFFAVIIAVSPTAFLDYMDHAWRKAIDAHLPDLFRSVVQAQETGMPLPQALESASRRDYGPLTVELKKMTSQISWGMSFEQALLTLGKRVNTVLVQRTVPMIIEASQSGGHVEKVFEPMGKFIQTTLLLDRERKTQTRPYIAIIYVAFFVFLFTVILLFKSFFVSVEGLPILGAGIMTPADIRRVFFHMTFIQGFFGGLVAGKMGEGTVSGGLKHSLALMLFGYIALKIFM